MLGHIRVTSVISKLDIFDWMADKGETSIHDGVFTLSVKPLDILNDIHSKYPAVFVVTKADSFNEMLEHFRVT